MTCAYDCTEGLVSVAQPGGGRRMYACRCPEGDRWAETDFRNSWEVKAGRPVQHLSRVPEQGPRPAVGRERAGRNDD